MVVGWRSESWFSLDAPIFLPLEYGCVVYANRSPVIPAYLYATRRYVDPAKTRVLRSPSGIQAANEENVCAAIH
jgi:glutathione synthase